MRDVLLLLQLQRLEARDRDFDLVVLLVRKLKQRVLGVGLQLPDGAAERVQLHLQLLGDLLHGHQLLHRAAPGGVHLPDHLLQLALRHLDVAVDLVQAVYALLDLRRLLDLRVVDLSNKVCHDLV